MFTQGRGIKPRQGQVREGEGVGKGQISIADATFGSQGASDSMVETGLDERCGVSKLLVWSPLGHPSSCNRRVLSKV